MITSVQANCVIEPKLKADIIRFHRVPIVLIR